MPDVVKRLVENNRELIIQRLPRYITPEQFFSLCYWLDRNPALAQAATRNPDGLVAAILKAADCGLMPGSAYDHCWFIPYKDEIQFQIGWRGLVYQLVRAGAVLKISAACVYEGDDFRIELGDNEKLSHRPNLTDDRRRDAKWLFNKENIDGAYAVAWLPSTLTTHRWCPMGEIEAARLKSKIPDGPAWTHFYPAMATKTAVRRLAKLIEVCGPTPENQEAWERFGRTIELENAQYRREPEKEAHDDLPMKSDGSAHPRESGDAAGSVGTERVTPPPRIEGRKKSSAAPSTPPQTKKLAPPAKEPEGPISMEQQDQLLDRADAAGIKASALMDYVEKKYGTAGLKITSAQAKEVEQYIDDRGLSIS